MIVQSTNPIVEFKKFNSKINSLESYYRFTPYNTLKYISEQNLQSYSYSRSANSFSGDFSLTVKDNSDNEGTGFLDQIDTLDVVYIYENGGEIPDFIGLVTNVSYNANAANFQKILTISGKEVSYLFEYLTMSLDATAMAYIGDFIQQDAQNNILKLSMENNVSIKQAVISIFNDFCRLGTDKASGLTNVQVINMIKVIYGEDFIEDGNENFRYPISSNFYTDSTINILSYIRNLLPENVYEIYGTLINGKPKLRIRENPYSGDKWLSLEYFDLKNHVDIITNYTVTRSIEEVYNVFFSYIEGSPLDPSFYNKKAAADKDGYGGEIQSIPDKIKKYGYKPLLCNFIGYKSNDKDQKLNKTFQELNTKLKNWYGNLDDMYDLSIGIVNTHDIKQKVGDKIKFLGGEFYIAGETHNWQYGQNPRINYDCTRGGVYDIKGNFLEKIKNITIKYSEWR